MRQSRQDAPFPGPSTGDAGHRYVLSRLLAITRRHYGATPAMARPPVSPLAVCDGAGFEDRLHASLVALALNRKSAATTAPASGRAPLRALSRSADASPQRGPDGGIVAWIEFDALESIEPHLREPAADELHRSVCARIENCAGVDESSVGRYGDESFAWTRPGAMPLGKTVALADAMLETLSTPLRMAGADRHLRPSLGFTYFPQDGSNPALLLTRACAAMRRARHYEMGYAFYSPMLDAAFASPVGLARSTAHNARRAWTDGAASSAAA